MSRPTYRQRRRLFQIALLSCGASLSVGHQALLAATVNAGVLFDLPAIPAGISIDSEIAQGEVWASHFPLTGPGEERYDLLMGRPGSGDTVNVSTGFSSAALDTDAPIAPGQSLSAPVLSATSQASASPNGYAYADAYAGIAYKFTVSEDGTYDFELNYAIFADISGLAAENEFDSSDASIWIDLSRYVDDTTSSGYEWIGGASDSVFYDPSGSGGGETTSSLLASASFSAGELGLLEIYADADSYADTGTSVVPVPPALWLFSGSLIAILGLARRRQAG